MAWQGYCPESVAMEDVYSELEQGWGFQKRELGAGDVFSTCHFNFICLNDGSWLLRGNRVMLDMSYCCGRAV